MTVQVEAIRAFNDNYIWAIHDDRDCVLVDPGDAAGPLRYLSERGLALAGILLTHHHADHTGGVDEIRARRPAPAWGPEDRRMPADVEVVSEGDTVRIPLSDTTLAFDVIETPGHTATHIAFHGCDMLFCGDTLFSVGCGRLFEGSPGQMQDSLDKLAALPGETRVYCAHEYTQANCRFARQVEPDNADLVRRCERVDELRRDDRITLPSTIAEEKAVNPFLRTREAGVIAAARAREASASGAAGILGVIRAWKDAS